MKQQNICPPTFELVELHSNDFPLKPRLAEYLLRYLSINNLLLPPIKLSFSIIATEESLRIAEQLHSHFSDSPDANKLKDAIDESFIRDELAESVSTFIERLTSKKYLFFKSLIIPP